MNFEFKSTFKVSNKLQSLHHAGWIILINVVSTITLLSLYLSNQIIPAVIGSGPNGAAYVFLAKGAIAVKMFSTLYASLYLAAKNTRKALHILHRKSGLKSITRALIHWNSRYLRWRNRLQRHVYASTAFVRVAIVSTATRTIQLRTTSNK